MKKIKSKLGNYYEKVERQLCPFCEKVHGGIPIPEDLYRPMLRAFRKELHKIDKNTRKKKKEG